MSHARGQDGETGDGIKLFTDEKNANALRGLLDGEPTLAGYLTAHLSRLDAGDYVALLAYIEMNDAHERALQAMRVEFGPRMSFAVREDSAAQAPASGLTLRSWRRSYHSRSRLTWSRLPWALLFKICGEFPDFGTAFDHSALNYTTLGYGDVIRRGDCWDRWRQQTGCACSVSRRHDFCGHSAVDSG